MVVPATAQTGSSLVFSYILRDTPIAVPAWMTMMMTMMTMMHALGESTGVRNDAKGKKPKRQGTFTQTQKQRRLLLGPSDIQPQ